MYLHYIHYNEEGDKYGINIISYNRHQVIKNNIIIEECDSYEEAQHYIDNIVFNN